MSCMRDDTEYDNMPYTPIAASSSAAPANEASSVALNRGRDTAAPIRSSSAMAS